MSFDLLAARLADASSPAPAQELRTEEVKARLIREIIRDDLTDRQRLYMLLYFDRGERIPAIAERFGVNKSTVSRTIARGKKRLYKSARIFLSADSPTEHAG
ncbi:MAG: helix-turn-helix domain-containing protein [Oscillospiraceae bacterium]